MKFNQAMNTLKFSVFFISFTALVLTSVACGRAYSQQELPSYWSQGLGTHNFGVTCFANATHKLLWSYFRDLGTAPSSTGTILGNQFNQLMSGMNSGLSDAHHERPSSNHGFKDLLSDFFEEFRNQEALHGSWAPITFHVQDGAEDYLTRLNNYTLLFPQSFGIQKREEFIYSSDNSRTITPYAPNGELALSLNINDAGITTLQQALDYDLRQINDGRMSDHPLTGVLERIVTQSHYILDRALSSSPPVIIFKLNRIIHQAGTTIKLTKNVTPNLLLNVPFERIDPSLLLPHRIVRHEDAPYELKSIVVHHGSAHGGHYLTYIRNSAEEWEIHNDTEVQLVRDVSNIQRIQEDIHSSGYLFLYTLRAPLP